MTTALISLLLTLMLLSALAALVAWARHDRLSAGRVLPDHRAAAHRERRPSAAELAEAGTTRRSALPRAVRTERPRAAHRPRTTLTHAS
ncbi:hypothetical protein ACJ5H2_08945 [Nocardioides sp. R1-1]|uniref:hypothetical protein n=1 Tax=Nocardioides sp. R1-1 TaxID=3383502 RepID=UPI0038D16829